MSGICDTCKRKTCEWRSDDIATCSLPKTESNWEWLFGTPERAARTLYEFDPHTSCRDCSFDDSCGEDDGCIYERDYDALLEWLRGDA